MAGKTFYSLSGAKKQITVVIPVEYKIKAEQIAAEQKPPVSVASIYAKAIKDFLGL